MFSMRAILLCEVESSQQFSPCFAVLCFTLGSISFKGGLAGASQCKTLRHKVEDSAAGA